MSTPEIDLPPAEEAMRRVVDAFTQVKCVIVDAHMSVRRACDGGQQKQPRVAAAFLTLTHALHQANIALFAALDACVLAGIIGAEPAIAMSTDSTAKSEAASEKMKPELEEILAKLQGKAQPGSAVAKLLELVKSAAGEGAQIEVLTSAVNERGECMCLKCIARRATAAGAEGVVH